MKKWVSMAMAAAVLAAALAGCGNGTQQGDAGKPVEITYLSTRTDIADTTLRDFADKFEEANPGIKLTIEAVKDYTNVARTRLAAGEISDIFRRVGPLKKDWPQYFLPLNDFKYLDDMMFMEENTLDGTPYAISTYTNYAGVIYNKKAFEKAGITEIPQTLDDLYAACDKLKAAGIVPTSALYKDQWPVDTWSLKLGPVMVDDPDIWTPMAETDTPFVSGTGLYEAAKLYHSFYERGYFENDLMSTSWEGFKPALAKGEFGWIYSETWLIPQIIENGVNSEDIGFFPLPTDNSGVVKSYSVPDENLVINKDSEHPEEAMKFLEYIMGDGYADWLALTGGFSTRKSYEGETIPQMEEFMSFNPQIVERILEPDEVTAIANKAQITWKDLAINSIDSGLEAAADELNGKWARAREK